jgi:hypothetical protein
VAGYGAPRDPVSELWDRAAQGLLERAYAARGGWVATRIKDPTDGQVARFRAIGIDPLGKDNAPTRSGKRKDMRSRWCRGFVRAVYYQNKAGEGRAIEIEVGARKPAVGVIPAGRAVRIRVRRGGQVASGAVRRKAEADRIYDDAGGLGGRWAGDRSRRDWE